MTNNQVYVKTVAGANEVKLRSRALPPRLRTMLIMVDGTRTAAQLHAAATMLGAPVDFLHMLLHRGLVAARPFAPAPVTLAVSGLSLPDVELPSTEAERFLAAQKFMNDTTVDALGLRAFFFTLKLEKAGTCADLRLLLPEFIKGVTKGAGPDKARRFEAQVLQTLG